MANKQSKRARREAARRAAQRPQRIRWAGLAAVITVSIGAFVVLSSCSSDQVAALAPDLELTSVDGVPVALSDYLGRPVAVTFMHSY